MVWGYFFAHNFRRGRLTKSPQTKIAHLLKIQPQLFSISCSIIAESIKISHKVRKRRYSTQLDAMRRYSTLLDATRRYSTQLDATRRYSTLLDATRRYSTQLDATRRYSTLLDATRCYSVAHLLKIQPSLNFMQYNCRVHKKSPIKLEKKDLHDFCWTKMGL
jgi:hypothetical protein